MSDAKKLKEKLFNKKRNVYDELNDSQIAEIEKFSEKYKTFLNKSKTEREVVSYFVSKAEKKGFKPFEYGVKYKPGDKLYITVNNIKPEDSLAILVDDKYVYLGITDNYRFKVFDITNSSTYRFTILTYQPRAGYDTHVYKLNYMSLAEHELSEILRCINC